MNLRTTLAMIGAVVVCVPFVAQAPDVADEVKRWAGQRFILRGFADKAEVRLSKADLSKPALRCDAAVEITKASYTRDRLQLTLEHVGTLNVPGGRGNPRDWCTTSVTVTSLTIADLRPADLASGLGSLPLLSTPEAYLTSYGAPFNLPPVGDDEVPLPKGPAPGKAEPRPLLMVYPAYNDEARKARAQGSATVEFVVGTDGRPHLPRVTSHPGYGLDRQVLRAISFWRFEPARQNGTPVAFTMSVQSVFSLR